VSERAKLAVILGLFAACFFLPVDDDRFMGAIRESLVLTRWYAREHVLLCLVPAFLIAGAVGVFVRQDAVVRYLGPTAPKPVAYGVAGVSGLVIAVCSCTILPLFSSIHRRGAGLGPAVTFLYAGPAISVLAIVLSARVFGVELGIARGIAAVILSVAIGLLMALLFASDAPQEGKAAPAVGPAPRPIWQDALFIGAMVVFLVFANWSRPPAGEAGAWASIHGVKWWIAGAGALVTAISAFAFYTRDELKEWGQSSWSFAVQILPLLLGGVLVAGLLLGGPEGGDRGLIPARWIQDLVGGNSLLANLVASVSGTLMYFATLTEVPIVQGLRTSGMGDGPALTLLLTGPSVSLPSLLVIRSVLGNKKTAVYLAIVIVLSTVAGFAYGQWRELRRPDALTATPAWTTVPVDALTDAEAAKRARGVAARDAMAGGLLTALQEALAQGSAPAIEVCQTQAPRIAQKVAGETQVRIGRTSFRLRNQANAPPAWAEPLLPGRPEGEVVARGPDGALGLLLPIRTAPLCTQCHGPKDTLTPEVQAALAARYPADQATGFAAGDLRGWFWVEVP
jgi:uncharacterized membrane protein YraQ (UPF0718 family)